MYYSIVFLYLLASTQSLTCEKNQQYVKVVKKSTMKAREESVEIRNPDNDLLFTGNNYADGELREDEVCLDNSVVFTLVMKDSHEDGWSDGSYVEIITGNGNSATKNFITSREESSSSAGVQQETVQFTLYSSINKGDSWKYNNSVETGWNSDTSYNEQDWKMISISNTQAIKASRVHYFRHAFEKPSFEYAAVELQVLYRDGVIVYINGEIVFQDNILIGGSSSSSITASGAYNTVDYRGTIIPLLLDVKHNVIAIEIHTENSEERIVQFDAFLTYHLSNAQTNAAHCFVVPTTYAITTDDQPIDQDTLMWSRNTYHTISRQQLSSLKSRSLQFNVIGNVYPSVNGIRMWPSAAFSYAPQSFKFSSGTIASSTTLVDTRLADYVSGEYKVFLSHAQSSLSPATSALELEVRSAMEEEVHLNLQFLVCSIRPAIDLQPLKLTYYSTNPPNEVDLGIYGATECQINGNLPSELSFNSATCKLTRGQATTDQMYVERFFTVTASANAFGKPENTVNYVSRVINIKYDTCNLANRALLNITRVYTSNPSSEGFRIKNGNSIIFEEKPGTTQIAYSTKTTFFCVASKTYEVELTSSINSWARNSYLYITSILTGGEEDMLLRARYCSLQGNEHIYYFHTHSIKPRDEWFYKMGSVPSNWLTTLSSDRASYPNYPASTNQIQLYQKTFLIEDLDKVAGIILGIRYRYGCIVYVNGYEIWRNGVEGSLSIASFSNHDYASMKWRYISIPAVLQEVLTPTGLPVHYLIKGTNRISIAIVSKSNQGSLYLTSNFDAMLRLMREVPESHTWAVDMSNMGMDGIATNVFDGYMDSTIDHHSCASNSLTISFRDDRREWISSIHIQNYYGKKEKGVTHFILQGGIQDEWETITTVSGLTWSMAGQKRRIYFANTKAYNSYRFINLGTNNPSDCEWLVQSLQLYADNIVEELPPLQYNDETIIFKDIEMAEITPIYGHTGYFNFRISPPLPNVLTIDPTTGWISGTPITDCNRTTYTVFATTYTGVEVNTTLTIECEKCTGTMGLITVRYRTDTYPHENSWKLYDGKNVDVESIRLMEHLPESNSYYYADFCMPSGIYTFVATNAHKEGWASNTGYTITVDYGDMEIDTMQMAAGQYDTVSVTSVFSTYIPFQVQYTEWHVYEGATASPPDNWKTSDTSSNWSKYFASSIPSSQKVTTYIRHSFPIAEEDKYSVLNVRVKYIGGVAAYFNGKLVARFNLEDDFTYNTESMVTLNDPIFSKFHILLTHSNHQANNIIAFEVHRPLGSAETTTVVFDATGVFGVESYSNKLNSNTNCITVVDSYSLQSSPLLSGSLEDIMDLDPFTVGALPNTIDSYMEWTVDNLEGSHWNQLNMYVPADLQNLGIDLFAWSANKNEENEKVLLLHEPSLTVSSRVLPAIDIPYAMGAFCRYRMQVINTVSQPILINSLFMKYCYSSTSTSICMQNENYPSVKRDEVSIYHGCGENKYGFTYKQCNDFFGPTVDECELKPIEGFRYQQEDYMCEVGVVCRILLSDIDREQFTIDQITPSPALPEGLALDDYGHIEGKPTTSLPTTVFTIYAENSSGRVFTTFTLTVTHIIKEIHKARYQQESYELKKNEKFVTIPECLDDTNQMLNCRYSITYDSRPLPAGLTLDEMTGTISGRPTEAKRSFVVITVENEEGEKTLFIEFNIIESESKSTLSFGLIIGIIIVVVVIVVVVFVVKVSRERKRHTLPIIKTKPTLDAPTLRSNV